MDDSTTGSIPDIANGVDGNAAANSVANEHAVGSDGGAVDPSSFVRTGRGRHPKDCICERCNAKRTGGGFSTTANAGQKSGAGKTGAAAKVLDVDTLAMQLVGVHKMLAMFAKNPLLEITQDEAKKLATASKQVMALHSINLNPSTVAYLQLLGVCVAIYGPRFAIYQQQLKIQREQQKQAAAMPNVNMQPIVSGSSSIQ